MNSQKKSNTRVSITPKLFGAFLVVLLFVVTTTAGKLLNVAVSHTPNDTTAMKQALVIDRSDIRTLKSVAEQSQNAQNFLRGAKEAYNKNKAAHDAAPPAVIAYSKEPAAPTTTQVSSPLVVVPQPETKAAVDEVVETEEEKELREHLFRLDEEARRQDEESRRQDEESRRQDEEARRQDEESRRQDEEKRRQDEEARRQHDERKRRVEEEWRSQDKIVIDKRLKLEADQRVFEANQRIFEDRQKQFEEKQRQHLDLQKAFEDSLKEHEEKIKSFEEVQRLHEVNFKKFRQELDRPLQQQ
jgi:hypothetical protein